MSERLLMEFRERAEHLVPMPDLDELQRRGTRLRRVRLAAGAAVVASALAVGGVVVTSGIGQRDAIAPATGGDENLPAPELPTGLPPEGAAPSTPANGELVASMWSPVNSNTGYVYADGRLIWQNLAQAEVWLEQRLTPEGVELVRAEILSSGLFDPDRPPPGSELGLDFHGDIQVRNGDRLVYVQGKQGQAWLPEFDRLQQRLTDLQSWLPSSAWQDREIRSFVPSRYVVCLSNHPNGLAWKPPMEPSSILSQLPEPAGELLGNAPTWRWDVLASRDLHEHALDAERMNYFADDVDSPPCFDVPTEDARTLTGAIHDSGIAWEWRNSRMVYRFDTPAPVSTTVHVAIWPTLPHGVPATTFV